MRMMPGTCSPSFEAPLPLPAFASAPRARSAPSGRTSPQPPAAPGCCGWRRRCCCCCCCSWRRCQEGSRPPECSAQGCTPARGQAGVCQSVIQAARAPGNPAARDLAARPAARRGQPGQRRTLQLLPLLRPLAAPAGLLGLLPALALAPGPGPPAAAALLPLPRSPAARLLALPAGAALPVTACSSAPGCSSAGRPGPLPLLTGASSSSGSSPGAGAARAASAPVARGPFVLLRCCRLPAAGGAAPVAGRRLRPALLPLLVCRLLLLLAPLLAQRRDAGGQRLCEPGPRAPRPAHLPRLRPGGGGSRSASGWRLKAGWAARSGCPPGGLPPRRTGRRPRLPPLAQHLCRGAGEQGSSRSAHVSAARPRGRAPGATARRSTAPGARGGASARRSPGAEEGGGGCLAAGARLAHRGRGQPQDEAQSARRPRHGGLRRRSVRSHGGPRHRDAEPSRGAAAFERPDRGGDLCATPNSRTRPVQRPRQLRASGIGRRCRWARLSGRRRSALGAAHPARDPLAPCGPVFRAARALSFGAAGRGAEPAGPSQSSAGAAPPRLRQRERAAAHPQPPKPYHLCPTVAARGPHEAAGGVAGHGQPGVHAAALPRVGCARLRVQRSCHTTLARPAAPYRTHCGDHARLRRSPATSAGGRQARSVGHAAACEAPAGAGHHPLCPQLRRPAGRARQPPPASPGPASSCCSS
jgi:hypothetical protein